MTYAPLRLNSLCLVGPGKKRADVTFSPGLNVIRGASDTGKSFIVDSIDYMLGGRDPLKQITESEGYNRVVLSLFSAAHDENFTLVRGIQGGDFELFSGDHLERPATEPVRILKASPQGNPNISSFLLDLIDLADKRVMKNKEGDTERLSFRNLVPLCVVDETKIQGETPPALSEQVVVQTKSKQVLKLLLTGVDDSGVVSKKSAKVSRAKADAQVELIEELVAELEQAITADGRSWNQLNEQLSRLDTSITEAKSVIGIAGDVFSRMRQRRFDLRRKSESNDVRQGEIGSLKARLAFLDQHYVSDLRRLEALSEAGTIYHASEAATCPFCGADAEHQKHHAKGEEEVKRASISARAEIEKISILRQELQETVKALDAELVQLRGELPLIEDELARVDTQIKEQMPLLQEGRERYAELLELRAALNVALDRFAQILKLEERRDALATPEGAAGAHSNVINPGLSEQTLYAFSRTVENILTDWKYPEPRTVSCARRTSNS